MLSHPVWTVQKDFHEMECVDSTICVIVLLWYLSTRPSSAHPRRSSCDLQTQEAHQIWPWKEHFSNEFLPPSTRNFGCRPEHLLAAVHGLNQGRRAC
jgi:hypothetical protein